MMQRRDFIKSIGGAGVFAAVGVPAHAAPQGWREFEITYNVALKDPKLPARLWLPVPQDALDYQRVVDLTWNSPVDGDLLWEKASRAPIVSAIILGTMDLVWTNLTELVYG